MDHLGQMVPLHADRVSLTVKALAGEAAAVINHVGPVLAIVNQLGMESGTRVVTLSVGLSQGSFVLVHGKDGDFGSR